MPPKENLTTLACAKTVLRTRIAAQRAAIVGAAEGVARPLVVVDECVALWRGLPPLVRIAGPALLALAAGRCLRSPSARNTLWHWLPIVLGALKL